MWSEAQIRKAGLNDFRVFLRQIWDHLGLPEPTPVQNDIAYYLQNGPRRLVIEAFRGVGKSWCTAAFVLWLLFCDPQLKVLVISASQERADAFSIFVKRLIENVPMLRHLKPGRGMRSSNISFDVGPAKPDQSPSVKSAGITGQITGSRADVIIPDDIEVVKNSFTHTMRERLAELVKEFDAVLKPGGRILYLGTPQTEQSLYNRLPQRGYEIRVWPAEIPQSMDAYGGKLAPYVVEKIAGGQPVGSPLDPRRFDEADLAERRASYGNSGYALQFMLDTNPSDLDKHPLKLQDLIVQDLDANLANVKLVWGREKELALQDLMPGGFDGDFYYRPAWKSEEMAEYSGCVMAIDPSGLGTDETSYAITKFLYGWIYLVAVGGFRSGYSPATLTAIAEKAKQHGVNEVITERNYGGGMFGQLFKPVLFKVHKCRFPDPQDMPWHTGQKELRILKTMEPLTQQHRFVVDRRVIEEDLKLQAETPRYSFIQQYTRLSREKGALPNEDRLEAVQMACQYWVDRMDRDTDKALENHKDKLLDEELRKFMNHARGTFGGNRFQTWRPLRNP